MPELPGVLTTERLVLRRFRSTDAQAFWVCIRGPEMGRYLEGPETPLQLADAEHIIAAHLQKNHAEHSVWAATHNGTVIGAASIRFEKAHAISEVGYSIGQDWWGNGFATEAVAAIIESSFQTYASLQRVQANIHPDNAASIEVAHKLGMQLEGTLRSYSLVRGEPANEAIYAVLRQEWIHAPGPPHEQ